MRMRTLVALLLLSISTVPRVDAAIAYVGGGVQSCPSLAGACTVTYTSTTGNAIVLSFTVKDAGNTYTITDSATNTYVALASSAGSNTSYGWKTYYVANATGATSFTVTCSACNTTYVVDVEEYSGVATASPLDAEATRGACFSGCSTALSATALTTTVANDVVVCVYNTDISNTGLAAGTIGGTTAVQRHSGNDGVKATLAVEDLVVSGTLSGATATATAGTTPSQWFMGCAAFKSASGGGGGGSTGCKNGLVLLGAGCDDLEDEPRAILPDSRRNDETKVPSFQLAPARGRDYGERTEGTAEPAGTGTAGQAGSPGTADTRISERGPDDGVEGGTHEDG